MQSLQYLANAGGRVLRGVFFIAIVLVMLCDSTNSTSSR
ncbi:hypothetical protein PAMC26577_10640 [Caballeronia sordidicola]|uniref:Uncharacterized protein n=1 Tax=Caballeronia sordidicola TaxID=196367 RepID=A0A242MYK7_CABSO|nr:hypothetical protein PAMC26577_10640 [Caballeronia sordidicola]